MKLLNYSEYGNDFRVIEVAKAAEIMVDVSPTTKPCDGKFVVGIDAAGEYAVVFFPQYEKHVNQASLMVKVGYLFVAAGYWSDLGKFELNYDSDTCRDRYGSDRPSGSELQKTVLAEVNEALLAIRSAIGA